MEKKYTTKNQIELQKANIETDKVLVSKVQCLIEVLESTMPDSENNFGEFSKYTSVWDDIDAGIIKSKILQLIKTF